MSPKVDVVATLENHFVRLTAISNSPGQSVHSLFAGLYYFDAIGWKAVIDRLEAPYFHKLVSQHFLGLYECNVIDHLDKSDAKGCAHWKRYHWLAGKLTMRSPISLHLLLLSLAARAHVYELSFAIRDAATAYHAETGQWPDLDKERRNLTGLNSATVFFQAALNFVECHKGNQRGWRHLILSFYSVLLKVLRPFWIYVLEGWRFSSWARADRDIREFSGNWFR